MFFKIHNIQIHTKKPKIVTNSFEIRLKSIMPFLSVALADVDFNPTVYLNSRVLFGFYMALLADRKIFLLTEHV